MYSFLALVTTIIFGDLLKQKVSYLRVSLPKLFSAEIYCKIFDYTVNPEVALFTGRASF